jgi:hypothetical protein
MTATATLNLFTPERLLLLYTRAPGAAWRHDVDVSLTAASRMARFAQLSGAQCTFAVMARSEFYNPFSAEGEQALREIREAGHTLVPHVHFKQDGSDSIYETVDADRSLWENAYTGWFNLNFVSFHMPPRDLLWRDFNGFDHAHASRWRGKYLSDSRREWTPEKCRSRCIRSIGSERDQ